MLYTVIEKRPTQQLRFTETHTLLVPAFSLAETNGQWFLPFFLTSIQATYYIKQNELTAEFHSIPLTHPALQAYQALCQLPETSYKRLIPYPCQVMLLLYHPTPVSAHPYSLKEILTNAESVYHEVVIQFKLTEVAKDRDRTEKDGLKKFGDTQQTLPSTPTLLDKLKTFGKKWLFEKETQTRLKKPKLAIPPHSPLFTEETFTALSSKNK